MKKETILKIENEKTIIELNKHALAWGHAPVYVLTTRTVANEVKFAGMSTDWQTVSNRDVLRLYDSHDIRIDAGNDDSAIKMAMEAHAVTNE